MKSGGRGIVEEISPGDDDDNDDDDDDDDDDDYDNVDEMIVDDSH